jgi:signal transduction histidine kinase
MIIAFSLSKFSQAPDIVIILLFIIVINNQVRFFNFQDREVPLFISLFLEFILLIILSSYIKNFNTLFLIPLIVDISFFIDKIYKYTLFIASLILGAYLSYKISLFYALEAFFIYSIVIALCQYINSEYTSKIKYLKINENLKISKDLLKRNNKDLEVYASSVEQLAILKERNRISREIHDSVGHSLSTTIIQLGAIEKLLEDKPEVAELVSGLREFVKENFQEVRCAVTDLKPDEYENYQNLFKIKELVENFKKLTDCDVKLTISKNTWSLSQKQSITLYRVIQESLSNSLRHGKASEVKIYIMFNKSDVITTISDNGIGCIKIDKGNGINSINERIYELNGKVEFLNSQSGFTVKATVPRIFGGGLIE